MTETRLALASLGWSDELIDAFLKDTDDQIPAGPDTPDPGASVETTTTEMMVTVAEPLIRAGTAVTLT